jgi:hypothetical protein
MLSSRFPASKALLLPGFQAESRRAATTAAPNVRAFQSGTDATASLAIARRVSAAVAAVVRGALTAGPARVVGKGGITHTTSQCTG